MAVFYIRERNAFYSWLTLNHISPTAQALWNALFTIYNAQGWPDEWLEVPESLLCSYMHVGKQALYDARNQLKNKGLLDFQKGNRNKQAVKYRPIWLTPRDEDTAETGDTPIPAPSFPQSYPQNYPQASENAQSAADNSPSWLENQTNQQTNEGTNEQTKAPTNQQTNGRTITPPLNKTTEYGDNNIFNKPQQERKTVATMSLTHAPTRTEDLPPVPLSLRHYLQWWDEMDVEGKWRGGFQIFLATDGARYTHQMLNCALTITQNKHDRHLLRNPLEYCKQTLIDWDRRGLTSRPEIEQYLDCDPTTGGYHAGLAWENDHEYEYS